jgi:putative spermidine/putrescine transport system permease protein
VATRYRVLVLAAVGLYVAPLLVLLVRALADVWRSPAVLPQQWGTRGLAYLASPGAGVFDAVANSLVVAVVTTGLALLLGWPAARRLAAIDERRRRPLLVVLALPLLVPPYAVGVGLTSWLLRLGLADRYTGLVLAHLVYVLPYVVLLLAPGFTRRVRDLEEQAATLGAGPLARLRRTTVPAVAPALAAATLLGLLVSWSQYGTSLAVAGSVPMLPVILLPFVGSDPQVAAAISLAFLAPALLALVATARLARQAR